MRLIPILILAVVAQATTLPRAQSGSVVDPSGNRLAGVRVFSNPFQEEQHTDPSGSFRLTAPGELVRFSKQGFRPRTVPRSAATGEIVLIPDERALWTPAFCPEDNTPRFGGLMLFGVPRGARLSKATGEHDEVTVLRHGAASLVSGIGPHWTYGLPVPTVLAEMTAIRERSVVTPQGLEGAEYRGTRRNGRRWRSILFFGESVGYDRASAAEAAYFDRILDGLCVRPPTGKATR